MAITLLGVPIDNPTQSTIILLGAQNTPQATLTAKTTRTVSITFSILSVPRLWARLAPDTPSNIVIPTGNIAFLESLTSHSFALNYSPPGGTQQRIIFDSVVFDLGVFA